MTLSEEDRRIECKPNDEVREFLDDLYKIGVRRIRPVGSETTSAVSYRRSVTKLVKHYPKEQDITLDQLAKRLGLRGRQTLYYWDKGLRFPSDKHRQLVLETTGIYIPPPPPHGKRSR